LGVLGTPASLVNLWHCFHFGSRSMCVFYECQLWGSACGNPSANMSTALSCSAGDHARCDLLDAEAVERRVHSEMVCAKRILEVQQTMFAPPSTTARIKFRRLVELFDTWEWLDLQELQVVPAVRLPVVNNGASNAGGSTGPCNQWWEYV
jgi:hypothetical protein